MDLRGLICKDENKQETSSHKRSAVRSSRNLIRTIYYHTNRRSSTHFLMILLNLQLIFQLQTECLTLIACCMKSIAMSKPKSSPAKRVNLLMIEHAPKIASKKRSAPVHTHTLSTQDNILFRSVTKNNPEAPQSSKNLRKSIWKISSWTWMTLYITYNNAAYHPVHGRNSFDPKSALVLAKLNMKVYISTVGSATPRISKGWPPMIECSIPHSAVDAKVWTAVIRPSAKIIHMLSSWSAWKIFYSTLWFKWLERTKTFNQILGMLIISHLSYYLLDFLPMGGQWRNKIMEGSC